MNGKLTIWVPAPEGTVPGADTQFIDGRLYVRKPTTLMGVAGRREGKPRHRPRHPHARQGRKARHRKRKTSGKRGGGRPSGYTLADMALLGTQPPAAIDATGAGLRGIPLHGHDRRGPDAAGFRKWLANGHGDAERAFDRLCADTSIARPLWGDLHK